jgi:hypothetical protein
MELKHGRLVWNPIQEDRRCQSEEQLEETCSLLRQQAEAKTLVNGKRIGAIKRIIHSEDVFYVTPESN